ncbi:MAG TPA: tetratricopeptide repeat protein [Steroidobacteraceae bacterium]|nr:tetratricopeptide repeat protein [Steroidobacteraceae bacterium]
MSVAEQRLQDAIEKHRAGDHTAAEVGYRAHLRDFPEDPSGLHFLGLLRNHQDRNEEAIQLMLAALERDPHYVDAWSNLGVAYFQQRDYERAEKCARKAIELAPGFANAWANLGMTLRARNDHEQALLAWGKALDLQPGMRNIAISYGHLLYKLNRSAEALEFYTRWQSAVPEDPIPQHMLAAMGGAALPARASDGYVRATFDDFADTFDRNLQDLGYRAPQLLCDAVKESAALARQEGLQVLDIGCGTGLCGPLLRPLARKLVGLDLSPNMLSKAALRAVYDQLNLGELTGWLGSCEQRFDLAVAADVLCYFGDLSLAFARVRGVLLPGGCFACSLEALPDDAAESYTLRPHGRYQHGRKYVEAMLADAGLRIVTLTQGTLRHERQDAVIGHLVVAAGV